MKYKIKLSEILRTINRGDDIYICHAIRAILLRRSDIRSILWVNPNNVFNAMHNIMPEVFSRSEYANCTVVDWINLNKVPNHLRIKGYRNLRTDEYRIELLRWMISKVGDQTLSVKVE